MMVTNRSEDEYAQLVDQIRSKIMGMLEGGDPVEFFAPYLFPAIVGEQIDRIRRAVLLQLVTKWDVHGDRTRLHILLCGPPGCGKTEILFWLRRCLGACFVGPATSKVGLKGDARGAEIIPGELHMAHGGVLCIDELDKFTSDRDALLEAMEEGSYKIRKGMHSETFDAEVRVLASANALGSFSAPLLDRFDFIFKLQPPSKKERKRIASSLVDTFLEPKGGPQVKVLEEYVEWCRDYQPDKEGSEEIKAILHSWIDHTNMDTSVRAWEASILRIGYALAKLHRENLKPEWVNEAIKIKAVDDYARWRGRDL